MTATWTVLQICGAPALLAGLPHLMAPGDAWRTAPPEDWRPVDGPEILLGAHAAPVVWGRLCASPTVRVYETENQLDPASPWRGPCAQLRHALDRARPNHVALNYSAVNAEFWGDEHMPLRSLPALPPTPRDLAQRPVDVLIYGAANTRREAVVRQCRERGLVVRTVGWNEPLFGAELAAAEKQAKIVLNVHHYMPGIFEAFRCVPAVSRGSLVLSEDSEGGEGEDLVFETTRYDWLAERCEELVEQFKGRAQCDSLA